MFKIKDKSHKTKVLLLCFVNPVSLSCPLLFNQYFYPRLAGFDFAELPSVGSELRCLIKPYSAKNILHLIKSFLPLPLQIKYSFLFRVFGFY